MSRDHTNLRVFSLAEQLVLEIYESTKDFPATERFVLQSQIRRAAISVVTNIVEGSAGRTTKDYVHFLSVATGSGAETLSLIGLARQLGLLSPVKAEPLEARYTELVKSLKKLVASLENLP